MDEIRVKDKKTGNIRTVTRKAYMALGPKVYERLGTEEQSQPLTGAGVLNDSPAKSDPQDEDIETGNDAPAESIETPIKKRPGRPARTKSISSDSPEDEK